MFSNRDLIQIQGHELTPEKIIAQVNQFVSGFPSMEMKRAAVIGDGILKLSKDQIEKYSNDYDLKCSSLDVIKFVPASGAASRMFKALFEFMELNVGSENQDKALLQNKSVQYFFSNLSSFAFYDELQEVLKRQGESVDSMLKRHFYGEILEIILTHKGMNYGNLPKGLLYFHKEGDHSKLPVEEHLIESAQYATSNGMARVHFTVSPEHLNLFKENLIRLIPLYEKKYGCTYEVSYSVQKNSTDTVAVTEDNQLFRNQDDSLLFRPAGHGALIENLNDLNAELIFIKNIDNVVPDRLKEATVQYKKALAGVALNMRDRISDVRNKVSSGEIQQADISKFLKNELNVEMPDNASIDQLLNKLNRPLRVCGMVINTGAPGGGPFWCENQDGSVSLQIVESSQMDASRPDQAAIIANATHFNPVDIVVLKKRPDNAYYDLRKYIDETTGFISSKSKDGKTLRAMELPGLWNGSMSDWNTIFVEVPAVTFNPVKEVNDLLKSEHIA